MATQPKQPIGVIFPIKRGSAGYFDQSFTVLEQVSSDLAAFLNTRPGERRMNPDFGCSLHKYVFEQMDDTLQSTLTSVVKSDVETWMPYISVKEIIIENTSTQRDNNVIKLIVTYTADVIGITNEQSVEVSISNTTS